MTPGRLDHAGAEDRAIPVELALSLTGENPAMALFLLIEQQADQANDEKRLERQVAEAR